jgi:Cys-tRNA(Pro)/Cys-tRNA(Cys) deacylase
MRTETKELCVFCQSALYEINLKKARTAADVKDVEPVKPAELLSLTGYVRGGCSPIGMKKQYRTFIDQQALQLEKIYISAGVRGQQIVITPQNLIKATGAQVCDLVLE